MKTRAKMGANLLALVVLVPAVAGLIRFGVMPQLGERHPAVLDVRDAPHVKVKPRPSELAVGDTAPDFSVEGEEGQSVQLADFRGKRVVLVFSRAHW